LSSKVGIAAGYAKLIQCVKINPLSAMTAILRNPATASRDAYDVIIVGGGIHGAMVFLEASRRGLRSLLLERDDFGGATSLNSLRIIHGGFRYLQTLDFRRFFESVQERQWFLKTFPDLIHPLPCLMPLYGNGLRKPSILNAALRLNDALSWNRNYGVPTHNHLPDGKIISSTEVQELFPLVNADGLQAGAVWYDACMPNSQRVLITILRWACALGGTALNYVAAKELCKEDDRVTGVFAVDQISGIPYSYQAPIVINAAGPWCRELAAQFGYDSPELFRPSFAWNVLFDRPALSTHALAIAPPKPNGHTYFFHPWKEKLLIGTVHAPWMQPIMQYPRPTSQQLQDFIQDLNTAIPQLSVQVSQIQRIFTGFLPVTHPGTTQLSTQAYLKHHGQSSSHLGLYSISGVKFTTSRRVAAALISQIFPNHPYQNQSDVNPIQTFSRDFTLNSDQPLQDDTFSSHLKQILTTESVQYLDDFILRRTNLGDHPEQAISAAPFICQLLDWDKSRCDQELFKLNTSIQQFK
jgi:glycerol-3-phosphate dehydrogenase